MKEHPSYAPLPDEPRTTRATPKDVRPYLNSASPVALCISCAVRRRLDGKIIKLAVDKIVNQSCADCGTRRAVLL